MSEPLSKEDLSRINNCDFYQKGKEVKYALMRDEGINVGEAYFIKWRQKDGTETYITNGWNSDPSKYMVFHKDDDGFVFVKRIIASGNLGKEVICLTTQFSERNVILEPDPEYVNSILLENEEGYDPLSAAKTLSSKKNKARRRNKKIELKYEEPQAAYDFIKTLRKGDILYDASTAYGSDALMWEVTDITVSATDQSPNSHWSRGNPYPKGRTRNDQRHNACGFSQFVSVELTLKDKELPRSRRWANKTQDVTFWEFCKDCSKTFYNKRPYSVDDV